MLSGIESFLVEKYEKFLSGCLENYYMKENTEKLTNACSFWFCLLQ